MTTRPSRFGGSTLMLGAALLGAALPSAEARASDQTTVKLIELLVKNGVLSRGQATALLHEAQSEAASAPARHRRARTETAVSTTPPAEPGEAQGPSAVHVTYVPPMVRDEIAAEVKQQVMQEAENEGWADQYGAADWTRRIRITGDIRIRGERDFFPGTLPRLPNGQYNQSASGNYPDFLDFNAINSSTNGYNAINNPFLPPLLNTTEDRTRFRLRARVNVDAQVTDWMDADIRVATGNDGNPVSENQTLGQSGAFAKYALWLDQAYLRARPTSWLTVLAGREYNPFWTSNLLFYDDLQFDGLAFQFRHPITRSVGGFLTAGGFPVFNTAFNFGSDGNTDTKYASHDAWLLAIQGGAEWKIKPDYVAKFAAGFFDFAGVEGAKSSGCLEPSVIGDCDTDNTRIIAFKQFGNTVMPLRDILADPGSTLAQTPQPQVYGLASKFEVLDLRGQFKVLTYSPIDVTLMGDFVKNLGFNRSAISQPDRFANNFAANSDTNFAGGDTAYDVALSVGHANLNKLWSWNASVAYKYIETDALLDSLTDPNFHLGGTNAKGYIINANLGLAVNTYLSATWYSASQVSGAPYSNDVLQVDLNARF